MRRQFFRFAVVGGVGFVVDISVFSLCLYVMNMPTTLSRVVAFLVAVGVTWLGNRIYTFGSSADVWPQLKRFAISAFISMVPNFLVFHLVLAYLGENVITHMLAFVLGVATGLCSNFALNTFWVFKEKSPS
ncbi:hypothetical protein JCM19241_3240 [Vibrio ishigakensis]|uniref:GtrA/DPMS transmembrane domain-containing protein n=1 Tax=Vibrio ishigakensis TaxID=1481914 RepID=A0A0B8QJN9_9VIBR|nr:hypothetical protein JCM19241_3240 [Vibrio ishigakensis]